MFVYFYLFIVGYFFVSFIYMFQLFEENLNKLNMYFLKERYNMFWFYNCVVIIKFYILVNIRKYNLKLYQMFIFIKWNLNIFL